MIQSAKEFLSNAQKNSIFAIGQAKEAMNNGLDESILTGLDRESHIFGDLFDSYDAKEGTKAFVEKRKANFQHRRRD